MRKNSKEFIWLKVLHDIEDNQETLSCVKLIKKLNTVYRIGYKTFNIRTLKSLRPKFKFGDMTMVDSFEIIVTDSFCTIKSILNHADGETKSPYYYDETIIGKNSKQKSLRKFTKWWYSLIVE